MLRYFWSGHLDPSHNLCPLQKVIIALSHMPRGFVPGQLQRLRPHFESIKPFCFCFCFLQLLSVLQTLEKEMHLLQDDVHKMLELVEDVSES